MKTQGDNTYFIAGGQSIIQAIKTRLLSPTNLIDLQAVGDLRGISYDGGTTRIGAMTRYCDIARSSQLSPSHLAIQDAAAHVGDRQVRNRGTIGGLLNWNYVSSCVPPSCVGVGAKVELLNASGERRILNAEDFLGWPLETECQDDEIMLAVILEDKANTGSRIRVRSHGRRRLQSSITRQHWPTGNRQSIYARAGGITMNTDVSININGETYEETVENRLLLVDFIRDHAHLTGTHVGCSFEGVCDACTVQFNGEPVKSCLMLATQANGHNITTVESLAEGNLKGGDNRSVLQRSFSEHHALQCGYCTPGILVNMSEFLQENPDPIEEEIRHALIGNICRCTGYVQIVEAVKHAASELRSKL